MEMAWLMIILEKGKLRKKEINKLRKWVIKKMEK